jgi:hypothetical protein
MGSSTGDQGGSRLSEPMCGRCARDEWCQYHVHKFVPGIDHGPGLPPRCLHRFNAGLEFDKQYWCLRLQDGAIHDLRCDTCGGSGILNVEERDFVELHQYGIEEPIAIWKPKASWCHACPEGELWKDLL